MGRRESVLERDKARDQNIWQALLFPCFPDQKLHNVTLLICYSKIVKSIHKTPLLNYLDQINEICFVV